MKLFQEYSHINKEKEIHLRLFEFISNGNSCEPKIVENSFFLLQNWSR
jgi:hypothetical protein